MILLYHNIISILKNNKDQFSEEWIKVDFLYPSFDVKS